MRFSPGARSWPMQNMHLVRGLYDYGILKNPQIQVGDTTADIKEGKNAGLLSVGVVEGSSIAGLSEDEYRKLSAEERLALAESVRAVYRECGADYIIDNFRQLPALIKEIEER